MTSLCPIGDLFLIQSYHRFDKVVALAKFVKKQKRKKEISKRGAMERTNQTDPMQHSLGNCFVILVICCFD